MLHVAYYEFVPTAYALIANLVTWKSSLLNADEITKLALLKLK